MFFCFFLATVYGHEGKGPRGITRVSTNINRFLKSEIIHMGLTVSSATWEDCTKGKMNFSLNHVETDCKLSDAIL